VSEIINIPYETLAMTLLILSVKAEMVIASFNEETRTQRLETFFGKLTLNLPGFLDTYRAIDFAPMRKFLI